MCDTFIVLAEASSTAEIIFAKNSDRPNGEIQDVITLPAQDYPANTRLQCTYIQIPQVEHCYAVVLSRPRWMWGAEMGANEHGVVIGNEAVWTNQACNDNGLLGMDLVRLGLERGATARQSMQIIIRLMEEFGQGGNCAEHFPLNYHNSFIIADPGEAWVLETAGKFWVAEKVTSSTRSISNNLSIRGKGDLRHAQLDRYMEVENISDFDFFKIFSMDNNEPSISPHSREWRVSQLCRHYIGNFTIDNAMSILREHDAGICMHGEFETRGSQVSVLAKNKCEHWFIEGPFPCQQEYSLREISP